MKTFIATTVITAGVVFGAAACGSGTVLPQPPASPVPSPTAPPALTPAQGASVCNDLSTWLQTAQNEGMPRFDATMQQDEKTSQGSQLGTDLSNLDADLQSENSDALLAGPPGTPASIQEVAQDCAGYGVTISMGGQPLRLP